MTLEEFAKLKPADRVVNPMLSMDTIGEVTQATQTGVRVRWAGSAVDYAYPLNSTAWMHWSKADVGA